MTPRLRFAAPLVVAALLLALPVHAQDAGPRVAYAGTGFALSPELGSSIAIVPVAAEDPTVLGPGSALPAHSSFSISRATKSRQAIPAAWRAPGNIDVFATADLAPYPWPNEQLTQLQALLADRPDLATFETPDQEGVLPYISGGEAAQIVRARAHYIDTPELSGIAYVAAFGQDLYRMGRDDFWYVFQGISADGSQVVQLTWLMTAPGFPAKSSFKASDFKGDNYARYLRTVIDKLTGADAEDFGPTITLLDGLIESITFESSSAVEAPTAPSPAPSASSAP